MGVPVSHSRSNLGSVGIAGRPRSDAPTISRLIPGVVIDHATISWLLRRREEWKDTSQRDIIRVHVVANGSLVCDKEEQVIDSVVTPVDDHWESLCNQEWSLALQNPLPFGWKIRRK